MIPESLKGVYAEPPIKPASQVQRAVYNLRQAFSSYPKLSFILSILATSTAKGATWLKSSRFIMGASTIVSAVGIATLLGTIIHWRHIPCNMIGVPVLAFFGIQWRHGMNTQLFEERKCINAGKIIGQVSYQRQADGHSIPVLDLKSQDNYECGFAQGYLLGKQIDDLFHRVLKPMMLLAQVATGDFRGTFYNKQVKHITIPEPYMQEIRGLVAGVHAYAKASGASTDLTVDTFVSAHKITDIYKSILCQKILGFSFFNALGCSTAVVKSGNEIGVCRTLDWPSLGMMGKYAILRRHQVGDTQVEMQTFPGIIGGLTTSNSYGLVAIINECGTISQAGVPYSFLTRQIIEQAKTVKAARVMIDSPDYVPASSHHLTVADRQEASNFQMLTTKERKYLERSLQYQNESEFFVVTNHAVDEAGKVMEHTLADSTSKKRYCAMHKTLKEGLEKKQPIDILMKDALIAVNTVDTVAAAIYTSNQETQLHPVQYVQDNNFAALHFKS